MQNDYGQWGGDGSNVVRGMSLFDALVAKFRKVVVEDAHCVSAGHTATSDHRKRHNGEFWMTEFGEDGRAYLVI